ncbi:hypothetical protein [Burkholderia multivorans]|uniref:hypothetical protein n=2 Tax=Burkholderia multivorans TaxID=87883 RepID=UPI0021BE68B7|nr:hypothetical protein [Burkholderia multivorans]
MFRNFFLRRALIRAAGRLAPNRIPLIGLRASKRDYYHVEIMGQDNGQAWGLLLSGVSVQGVEGFWWNGNEYHDARTLPWSDIEQATVEFRYYLGLHEFYTTSPRKLELWSMFGFYRVAVTLDRWRQRVYDRRSPTTVDRLAVLKHVVAREVEGQRNGISAIMLAAAFHGTRSVFHPKRREQYAYYDLVLRSLEDDGLLERRDMTFVLHPRALTALHNYENEERRHRTNRNIQIGIVALTVCSVLAAAAQAWPQLKDIWTAARNCFA